MKTIAVRAGVTQATAAMCLAHNPRIPAAPRERIQGLARELDYQPKPDVSTLLRIRRQGKPRKDQPVVALVWAQRTEDGWRNHPAAIIRQMREGGFRTEEFWLHRDGMANERFSAMLRARHPRPVAESARRGRSDADAAVGAFFRAMPGRAAAFAVDDHRLQRSLFLRAAHHAQVPHPRLPPARPAAVAQPPHAFSGTRGGRLPSGGRFARGLDRVAPL